MACSADRLLRAWTGISVSALSSSHRCLRECRPRKQLGGTELMRLASRRLGRQARKTGKQGAEPRRKAGSAGEPRHEDQQE